MTALSGLKKWMVDNDISVVDLNWNKLRKHGISMQKLLQWEMHSRRKKAKESRPTVRRVRPCNKLKADMPLCVQRKGCETFVIGYCGGKGSNKVGQFACYGAARSAVA